MPPRRKKKQLFLYLKLFTPIVLLVLIAAISFTVYAVNTVTKPNRSLLAIKSFPKKLPDRWGQVVSFTWTEVQISAPSGTLTGWLFIRGAGLPGIVLTHGLNSSRADLMDLGYRLWERGYNVLVYDLRAHGENLSLVSTLGAIEKKDLAAAVEYFKSYKVPVANRQEQLVDQNRIGLYGVNIGAYASLMVGGEEDTVKAVFADMPYDSVREFAHLRSQEILGLNNPVTNTLLDIGLQIKESNIYNTGSVRSQIANYQGKGKSVAVLIAENQSRAAQQAAANLVAAFGPTVCERIDMPKSRNLQLAGKDADLYNERVCTFFAQRGFPVLPSLPTAPPEAGKPAPANETDAQTSKEAKR